MTDSPFFLPHIGRLLTAKEVAEEIFGGKVTPRWVKETLRAGRAKLGHNTVFWEEYTVQRYILDLARDGEG